MAKAKKEIVLTTALDGIDIHAIPPAERNAYFTALLAPLREDEQVGVITHIVDKYADEEIVYITQVVQLYMPLIDRMTALLHGAPATKLTEDRLEGVLHDVLVRIPNHKNLSVDELAEQMARLIKSEHIIPKY